jgi:RNA polymerase sigma-70 factor (ECF subfamily)
MVAAALQTLTEKERVAVVLRDIQGLSTREVAGVLGSAEVTVRTRIWTARVKIKKFVERLERRRS